MAGAISQGIVPLLSFPMVADLLRRGLPHVDIPDSLEMFGSQLLTHVGHSFQWVGARLVRSARDRGAIGRATVGKLAAAQEAGFARGRAGLPPTGTGVAEGGGVSASGIAAWGTPFVLDSSAVTGTELADKA